MIRNPLTTIEALRKENDAYKEIIERKSLQIVEMRAHVRLLVDKYRKAIRQGSIEDIEGIKFRINIPLTERDYTDRSSQSNGGKSYRPTDERYFREKRRALLLKHLSI